MATIKQEYTIDQTKRLETLDVLRGLAIFGVVVVHTTQSFPTGVNTVDSILNFGRFGVQLFYFISAFTMCYMWELRRIETHKIRKFYIRRFFRIAPLFWIAILVYTIVNARGFSDNATEIILASTFLHGFSPEAINGVVPGGWSIAVEMTFYAIFPFLYLFVSGKRYIYPTLAFLVWLLWVLLIRDVLSDALFENGYSPQQTKEYLYFFFLNQAPVFILGCYMYCLLTSKIGPSLYEVIIFFVWCALCVAWWLLENDGQHFRFPLVYMAIGLSAYFILMSDVRIPLLESLGRNSYSIYLTHFLIIDTLAIFLPNGKSILVLLIAILIVSALAYVISVFIRNTIEKWMGALVKKFI